MSRKDVKHVNWPRLGVLTLYSLEMWAPLGKRRKLWFSDDIVIKLATSFKYDTSENFILIQIRVKIQIGDLMPLSC